MRSNLGEFEEIVLLTTGVLFDEAFGLAIKEDIEARLERKVSIGALHSALRRLEKKGFLNSRLGEATNERGGKRKRYFTVSTAGKQALEDARDSREKLWDAIPKAAFNLAIG